MPDAIVAEVMGVAFVAKAFSLDPATVAGEPSWVVRRLRSACAGVVAAVERHEFDKAKAKAG